MKTAGIIFQFIFYTTFCLSISAMQRTNEYLHYRIESMQERIESFERGQCVYRVVKVFDPALAGYLQERYCPDGECDGATPLTPTQLNQLLDEDNLAQLKSEVAIIMNDDTFDDSSLIKQIERFKSYKATIEKFQRYQDTNVMFCVKLPDKEFKNVIKITKTQREEIFTKTIALLKIFFEDKWDRQPWAPEVLKSVCMEKHPAVIADIIGDCSVLFSGTTLDAYFKRFKDLKCFSPRCGLYRIEYSWQEGDTFDFYLDEEPYSYGTDNIAETIIRALQFHLNFIDFFTKSA